MAKIPSEGRKDGLSSMENGKGLPFRKRVGDGNFTIFRKMLNRPHWLALIWSGTPGLRKVKIFTSDRGQATPGNDSLSKL